MTDYTFGQLALWGVALPNYRRAFVPGGCWFFTVNLLERRKSLLVDRIDMLRDAMDATRRDRPFIIDAIVVLPDHIHAASSRDGSRLLGLRERARRAMCRVSSTSRPPFTSHTS